MALDIAAIRTAIAATVTTALAATSYPANVVAREAMPGVAALDAGVVEPGVAEYAGTFGANGLATATFSLEMRAGTSGASTDPTIRMDVWRSTNTAASVFDAINNSRTSSGSCGLSNVDVWCGDSAAPVLLGVDGQPAYWACKFTIVARVMRG